MRPTPRAPSAETSAVHDTANARAAGVLLVCTTTKRLLLGLRGTNCSCPETWAPFGGMVEPGETSGTAAFRELSEEAGITLEGEAAEGVFYVNHGKDGFQFVTYLYLCDTELNVTINEESSGYAWFGFDKMPSRLHPGFIELTQSQQWRMLTTRVGG